MAFETMAKIEDAAIAANAYQREIDAKLRGAKGDERSNRQRKDI